MMINLIIFLCNFIHFVFFVHCIIHYSWTLTLLYMFAIPIDQCPWISLSSSLIILFSPFTNGEDIKSNLLQTLVWSNWFLTKPKSILTHYLKLSTRIKG